VDGHIPLSYRNRELHYQLLLHAGIVDALFAADCIGWRVPNPAKYQIEAAGGAALGTGDVTILGRDVIHSVVNPFAKISGAIHVYDGDFLAI
jgi:hypothetical protein